jgi:hypothetical protein
MRVHGERDIYCLCAPARLIARRTWHTDVGRLRVGTPALVRPAPRRSAPIRAPTVARRRLAAREAEVSVIVANREVLGRRSLAAMNVERHTRCEPGEYKSPQTSEQRLF